jgi:hypothetical protein
MAQKEIALLKKQLAKLDDKKFDLEAWKNYTIIFLERIFGNENSKLNLIRELHYDYSSWNLRDTAAVGKIKGSDPVKIQAREILNATITELEKLGLPKNISSNEKLWNLTAGELTGKQAKEIEVILNSDAPEKPEKISKIIEKLEQKKLASIIAKSLIK